MLIVYRINIIRDRLFLPRMVLSSFIPMITLTIQSVKCPGFLRRMSFNWKWIGGNNVFCLIKLISVMKLQTALIKKRRLQQYATLS